MKIIKNFTAAVIMTAFAFTGCQEEKNESPGSFDNYYASVETFGTDTKTSLGEDNSVVWSTGDLIAIFAGGSDGQAYRVLDSYVGKNSGEFSLIEGMTTNSVVDDDRTIAVYPFNEDLDITKVGNGSYIITGITFPSEQRYSADSFSDEAFPMAALSPAESRNLSFKNIGGILKLSLTGSYSVSQITLTGNSGEPLSGSATVFLGSDGIPYVEMNDDASRSVTLVCDPAVELNTKTATDFYISVPPTDFEAGWLGAGFTVTVTDIEGRNTIKKTEKQNSVKRSGILAMPEFAQDALVMMNNVPYSNWDLILTDLNQTALCFSYAETGENELLAIMDGEYEIHMHFDDSDKPVSYYSDDMEVHIEYGENNATYYFNIDGISIIDTAIMEMTSEVKSSTEENVDLALGIAKSEWWNIFWDKVADVLEKPLIGYVEDFIETVNFLKKTDGIETLEMTEYLESNNDLVQFIDLIKNKPTHWEDNSFITYSVGIKAGDLKVSGEESASLELQGTITGQSNGKTFNFEYGLCYSTTNQMPTYYDSKVSSVYIGMENQSQVYITLPVWFEISGLSEDKYYYRAFFRDCDTGNIIYSYNTEILKTSDQKRWVDLGLSVLWAAYNVGANSPEEYGGYYAWGETEEKDIYIWENYKHAEKYWYGSGPDEWYWTESDISEICQTSYDVAHVKWGDGARMPRIEEVSELIHNCTFKDGSYNGITGNYVIGPNGNSIFLPYAGFRDGADLYLETGHGYYWTGSYGGGYGGGSIHNFGCYYNGADIDFSFGCAGLSVRAVKAK